MCESCDEMIDKAFSSQTAPFQEYTAGVERVNQK
jgi:hypothetical protein